MEGSSYLPVSIVVPVKNEEENIVTFLNQIHKEVAQPFEIIVVYDELHDQTPDLILNYFDLDKQLIKLIRNDSRPGFYGAIRKGVEKAFYHHVVVTMADGSDRAADINRMRQKQKKDAADIVCASRFSSFHGRQFVFPLKQNLAKKASRLLQNLTGIPTLDVTNNFKLYRKSLFAEIPLSKNGSFEWSMEFTAKAFLRNYRISEIETEWSDRQHGKSNFNLVKLLPKYAYWFIYLVIRKRASDLYGSCKEALMSYFR